MGSNNYEDINFLSEYWAGDGELRLCEKLDELISKLVKKMVYENFKHVNTHEVFQRVLSLRICSSEEGGIPLSSACKYVVDNIIDFISSDYLNGIQHDAQLFKTLELSLECLFICAQDDFCVSVIELITRNIPPCVEHQIQHCKVQRFLCALKCFLNAIISIKVRTKLKNHPKTLQFLKSGSFHQLIAELLLNCDDQNLSSYIMLTVKLIDISNVDSCSRIIWNEMIKPSSTISHIPLSFKMSVLCGLGEIYISKYRPTCNFSIVKLREFWELIQKGLVAEDAVLRKKALYLLKRSVDVIATLNSPLDLELFSWNCITTDSLQKFWEKMFIVFETIEEKQPHLVIPVVQSFQNYPENVAFIHPSWFVLIYSRLLSHDSLQVVKVGMLYFLNTDIYVNCSYRLVIRVLFQKLNNMLLYSSKQDGAEWAEIDDALKKWFTAISLNTEIYEEFFSIIFASITEVQWCPVALFHILYNLSLIPTTKLFKEQTLSLFCDFLKEAVRTHDIFIRGAIQCAVLDIVTKYTKTNNLNVLNIVKVVSAFKQEECLHRGLETWEKAKQWVHSCIHLEGEEILVQLLHLENCLSLEAKARSLVLFFDAGLINSISNVQDIIRVYFSVLEDTGERPYASVEESDRCLKLIAHILDEARHFSPEFDYKNDSFIRIIIPFINEIIPYIRKRLFDKELHYDNIELYIKTLQVIRDRGLVSLVEGRKLIKLTEEVCFSSEYHPVQRYFGFNITLWFIQFVIKEMPTGNLDSDRIKSYCLTIIKNGHLVLKSSKDIRDEEIVITRQGKLVSGYTYVLWTILQHCIDAEFVTLPEILSMIPAVDFIHTATDSIELGGRESLPPILRVVKAVLPYIKSNSELCQRFLHLAYKSCFELRKVASFWPAIKAWIEMCFNTHLIVEKELQITIKNFSEQILSQGEAVRGLSNALLSHLKRELRDIECVMPLLETLTSALTFGPVPRRDQRIESDTCSLIASLGPDYAVNALIPQGGTASSSEVRICALSILLSTAKLDGGEEVLLQVVSQLLARDAQLTAQRQRYHGDSLHHRLKHRILQALLVLGAVIAQSSSPMAKSCVIEVGKWASASLQGESQQPSVRYQLEWLLVYLVLHCPELQHDFWTIFNQASDERTGSICSFISVAYHLAASLRDSVFTDRCVTEILPWCMAQHFNIRLYSQVVLQKLWPLDSAVASKYEVIRNSLTRNLNQGNSLRNVEKLKNDFYFTDFRVCDHFSFETIFWELPRLSNITRDEWVSVSTLKRLLSEHDSLVPLTNQDQSLKQFSAATWVVKATAEASVEVEACGMQKKFVPWKSMFPELEALGELPSHTELIVVASLIDKVPNLGGLARSCEIFAARCLVVASLEYTQDKLFSTLSMSAEKHINIVEVKPHNLPQYLQEKKSLGYTLVGAEQTAASVSLTNYKFPQKCLLLLGSEKEGIPVNLLPLVDVCVEVFQLGVVRSLNVHVTGALFLWEYTKQHLPLGATNTPGR